MALGLFLLLSDGIPNLCDETEGIMVTVQNDDDREVAPPPEGEIDPRRYSCVTTLVANYDDWAALRDSVAVWWRELTGMDAVLELLATDVSLISSDQRESLAALEPESWSVRTPVVLFWKDQEGAEAEARKVVVECALSQN